MYLLTSKTPRQLENKLKLLGFELLDIFLIFLYLSLSNLIFGQTMFKFLVVYVGTLSLAVTLYFVKRGKPDDYLQDKLSSFVNPNLFSANILDTEYKLYFKRKLYEKAGNTKTHTSNKLLRI